MLEKLNRRCHKYRINIILAMSNMARRLENRDAEAACNKKKSMYRKSCRGNYLLIKSSGAYRVKKGAVASKSLSESLIEVSAAGWHDATSMASSLSHHRREKAI